MPTTLPRRNSMVMPRNSVTVFWYPDRDARRTQGDLGANPPKDHAALSYAKLTDNLLRTSARRRATENSLAARGGSARQT